MSKTIDLETRNTRETMRNFVLICVILAFLPLVQYSQTEFAQLKGTVQILEKNLPLELTGKSIKVTLRNLMTEKAFVNTLDMTTLKDPTKAEYYFYGLLPSFYEISVSLDGKDLKIKDNSGKYDRLEIEILRGQVIYYDVVCENEIKVISATNKQNVNKSGDFVLLESPVNQSTQINRAYKATVPIRNETSYLGIISPNANAITSKDSSSNSLTGYSYNGLSSEQNSILVNGLDITPLTLSSASFQENSPFFVNLSKRLPLEPFDSLKLDNSNYPSKGGTGAGGKLTADVAQGDGVFRANLFGNLTNDRLSTRNFFDLEKPHLKFQHLGGNAFGRIPYTNKNIKFFIGFENIQIRASSILFELAPSDSAKARAVSSIQPLLSFFNKGNAVKIVGASSNPDLEFYRLDTFNIANQKALTSRFDFSIKEKNQFAIIYRRSETDEDKPDGISGRRQFKRNLDQFALVQYIYNNNNVNKTSDTNEFIFGFNGTPKRFETRFSEDVNLANFNLLKSSVTIGGNLKPTGIVGQPFPISFSKIGGLLSSFGSSSQFDSPNSFLLVDQFTKKGLNYSIIFGGEVRFNIGYLNQLNGLTYSFATLDDFLQNKSATINLVGDSASFDTNFVGGQQKITYKQFVGFAQHQWSKRTFSLTYGLRYDFSTVPREVFNRNKIFNLISRSFDASDKPFFNTDKNNLSPRIAFAWTPSLIECEKYQSCVVKGRTIFSGSFGIFAGAAALAEQIKPIDNNRITYSTDGIFPVVSQTLKTDFFNKADTLELPLVAYDKSYTNTIQNIKYDFQFLFNFSQKAKGAFFTLAYSGSKARNLLLRTIDNPIISIQTNPDPNKSAFTTRKYTNGTSKPFGEIDVFTSKGRQTYNSFTARFFGGLERIHLINFDFQYTLSKSVGNTNGGSDAVTTGNPADFEYDWGYNLTDAKHKFNVTAVIDTPEIKNGATILKTLFNYWTFGIISNTQSGSPIDIKLTRPNVVYVDVTGKVFSSPAVGRSPVLNLINGGATNQRPNYIFGVNPFLDKDRFYLNPAIFSIPSPGTLGNLKRGEIRGPGFSILDLSIRKVFRDTEQSKFKFTFQVDITNLFNKTNFSRPPATLPNLLGTDLSQFQIQPNQSFGTLKDSPFGIFSRSFKRDQDISPNRQIQFTIRININTPRPQL